jgi:hypothetical protein
VERDVVASDNGALSVIDGTMMHEGPQQHTLVTDRGFLGIERAKMLNSWQFTARGECASHWEGSRFWRQVRPEGNVSIGCYEAMLTTWLMKPTLCNNSRPT